METGSQKGRGPRILSLDLETYSDVDLGKCGLYRYVEGDFHILLCAYAFDDDPVQIVDLSSGEELPQDVIDSILDPAIIKSAWNAQFERVCLSKYLDDSLSPDSWQCSMVWAASLSLPLKLKTAAQVLKTGEQKDNAGERLIRYFSVPCKPTKANGERTRNLPEHDPEGWQTFKDYCAQDVRTERDIRKRLEQFPLQDSEWNYYHMDQRIMDCPDLVSVTLPLCTSFTGTGAMRECLKLENIDLPLLKTVSDYAFLGCTKLQSISLPSLTSCGTGIFFGCTILESVSLPKLVSVGNNSFYNCPSLTQIDLPSAKTIGSAIVNGSFALEVINIGPSIVSIHSSAFQYAPDGLVINLPVAEGVIANAPWGAPNAVINYNTPYAGTVPIPEN